MSVFFLLKRKRKITKQLNIKPTNQITLKCNACRAGNLKARKFARREVSKRYLN